MTLSVFANPYIHLDHLGRPAGACPCDPIGHTPDRRWVGAWIERAVVTEQLSPEERSRRSPAQDTVFGFSDEAETIPQTAYYLSRIRDGELVPADAATARAAGVRFTDPHLVLEATKKKALDDWAANYGAPGV